MAWLFALAAGLMSLLGQRAARADGAFPQSESVMIPALRPHEILMATNFGVMSSVDDGQTWVWSCEQDKNTFGIFYQLGALPLERMYAVSQGRLVYSDDGACSWTVAGGAPAGGSIIDVFPDPGNVNRVLSVADLSDGDGGVLYVIFESTDAGATVGTTLYRAAAGDAITGIETARSRPATIYVTLLSGSMFIPKLVRSDDGGTSWQVYDVSTEVGQKTASAVLISVDPTDPQRVLLRVRGASAEYVGLTTDGGASITLPLSFPFPGGVITSFARMPSGTIVVGGTLGGDPVAFRSTDRGQTFAPLPPPPHLRGLAARGGILYGVADNVADGYAIAVSADEGMTWQPLVRYDQIQAIAACVKATCQADCLMRAAMDQWPAAMCDATPMPQPIITDTDGGARDAAPDVATAPADAGHDGSSAEPRPPVAHKGCACSAAPSDAAAGPWAAAVALALALALLMLRRRQRRW